MSLINDMLKDLDRDQSAIESPLPSGLVEKKPEKSANMRRFFLPGLALMAVAYAVVIEWNILGVMPDKKSASVEVPQPISLNSKWLKQAESAKAVGIDQPITAKTPAAEVSEANQQNPSSPQEPSADIPAQEPSAEITSQEPSAEITSQERSAKIPAQEPSAEITSQEPSAEMPAEKPAVIASEDSVKPDTKNTNTDEQFIAEEPSREIIAGAPSTVDETQAVQRLLDAAAHALAENRLTTPSGDNAYHLYKSALVIDPNNAAAHSAIESIRQRYLNWLDKAVAENKIAVAQLYWQKAKNVGVDAATLSSYQATFSSYESALVSPSTNKTADSAVITLPEATITPAATPNDEELAARLRREGLRYEQDALRLLRQMPNAVQSPVALADLYVDRRAVTELQRLAELLKNQPAENYVAAHLQVFDGQESAALNMLAATEYSGDAERQRLRLLAGLRQKAGEHSAAMKLYANLVTSAPDNVSDWLGLAVSADKGKLIGTALNAYEKVLLLRHPDQRVMQYARQRQQDLSVAAATGR